jgi:hypothetical protein
MKLRPTPAMPRLGVRKGDATFAAGHNGIELVYQCFSAGGDPLLQIMGIGADML